MRFTADELRQIEGKMRSAGIRKKSAYLRKMALDGFIVHLDMTDVKELVRLLRICSNNLNQYAKVANGTGYIGAGDIADLKSRMQEIWKMTKAILNRLAAIR